LSLRFIAAVTTLQTLFASRWLVLHKIGHWEFVKRPNSNAAVGILAITDDDEILLVEQYRIPLQCHVIEIPAGLVGDEPEFAGESLEETARRELLEETGYEAASMVALLKSPTSAGMTSEMTHIYQAGNLRHAHSGGGVGSEKITVHKIPLPQLRIWLEIQQQNDRLIDFKIHAALAVANIRF
jgi:ADP-ribose pyrophosphatase